MSVVLPDPVGPIKKTNSPSSIEKERFEVYPNRDSLPFIDQYEFENNWKVKRLPNIFVVASPVRKVCT